MLFFPSKATFGWASPPIVGCFQSAGNISAPEIQFLFCLSAGTYDSLKLKAGLHILLWPSTTNSFDGDYKLSCIQSCTCCGNGVAVRKAFLFRASVRHHGGRSTLLHDSALPVGRHLKTAWRWLIFVLCVNILCSFGLPGCLRYDVATRASWQTARFLPGQFLVDYCSP